MILESTVCGIPKTENKIPALFSIFAVAGIVPCFSILVIKVNRRQRESSASLERKRKDPKVAYLVGDLETLYEEIEEELETSLSQIPEARKVKDLLQEYRRQVYNLASFDKRDEAIHQAMKCIHSK
ncbi:MAG: hypothetical protein F6J98_30475 [Moorea sp. SIO4G2]|nr:hypothetical protein [Moorena sp. SIO4G2]